MSTQENIKSRHEMDYDISTKENVQMKWTCEKLIKSFKALNECPLLLPQQIENIDQNQTVDFPFKPTIDNKSKKIANKTMRAFDSKCEELSPQQTWENNNLMIVKSENSRNESAFRTGGSGVISRVEMMYEKQKETKHKIECLRQELKKEEVKGCTFHPLLYLSPHIKKERKLIHEYPKQKPKTTDERKLEECTFHPALSKE